MKSNKIIVRLYGANDFKPGEAVLYIPCHAEGDPRHKDVEIGVVSSQNGKFVFVKYSRLFLSAGWYDANSQATDPFDLIKVMDLEFQEMKEKADV
jgi:hypothetical protein